MTKRIIIVGATSGIGKALHDRMTSKDWEVIAFSRSHEPSVDVTQDAPPFPSIEGPVHGLAYCPGSINLKPFTSLTIEDFRDDFDVNVLGAVRTLQQYLPNLKQAENASVVLFSTVAVQAGMGFHASIAAAKGAVEGLARSLAAELAPGIRVNAIAPSLTDTNMAQRLLRTDRQREAASKRHPLGRIGNADDVSAAAEFLLSAESSWMTGQVLGLDGGMSALRMI